MRCLNCMQIYDEEYGVCPHCGYVPSGNAKELYQLTPGIVLNNRYLIGTALGVGGFGITYVAWDQKLEQKVAIKEFYPSAGGIVNRSPGVANVIIYSGEKAIEFEKGKQRFLTEARSMARFSGHPNIVHVYEYFEQNSTAYIAMEFLEGKSFKDYLKENNGPIDCNIAKNVILAVLDALKEIHRAGIIHRDISPDNVFISPEGVIKVIDFGAARFSTGEEEKTMSIILKPGYAPPEQYRTRSSQGPWTDVYAVGAMFYRAVTGVMPDESVNRMVEDKVVPPDKINNEVSSDLSNIIMTAMALDKSLRFKNVDQFEDALLKGEYSDTPDKVLSRRKKFRIITVVASLIIFIIMISAVFSIYNKKSQKFALKDGTSIEVWLPPSDNITDEKVADQKYSDFDELISGFKKDYAGVDVSFRTFESDEEYQTALEDALDSGGKDVPTVFDSTYLDLDEFDGDLDKLDTTYDFIDLDNSRNIMDYYKKFKDSDQVPLSVQYPLIYRNEKYSNSNTTETSNSEESDVVIDYDLDTVIESGDYALNPNLLLAKDSDISSDKTIEDFVNGECLYYISDTSDYKEIQENMAGKYSVSVVGDKRIKLRFTNLVSVNNHVSDEEKKAGEILVYFLMKEKAQQVLNIKNNNGVPVNSEILNEYYLNTYVELKDIGDLKQ
ncbi:serine/threonine protein kinase [Lachnoanaerobaculum umeaense]|uniref:Uncharacterized protein n=1 Tax=Lachnoanaerobaculum umeaense TaxID=617123 RepID=A0A385PZJ1_9FIRM|nr:protein kinase [Lachnoanaerobaculum umeaense]AYA99591.1 hypothetical protein D4A81_06365 [Lachnoanaerobaculum umeaense]PZW96471.1 serine/threonine protein kinase [Lachnoanaerobaculum umeaense]